MQIGNEELDLVAASAIVPACSALGLEAKRVDKHNRGGLLKSEIVNFILESDIIVADLTNERPNCYLEIGYAMGAGKLENLILTVREDHFPDNERHMTGGPRIHFDLAGYDILSWNPLELEKFRGELEKRIRRRLALAKPKATAPDDSTWVLRQKEAANEGAKKANVAGGYMEVFFIPAHGSEDFSPAQLNHAVEKAQIKTFGWPIAPHFTIDDLRPRPVGDGIFAEIRAGYKDSYDYWAARCDGQFYWRGSLFEDTRQKGEIFFDTRIVRVAEVLRFCSRLYDALGYDRKRVVTIHIRHAGLKGRTITAANFNRLVRPRAPSLVDESEVTFTVRLEQIDDDLVGLVKRTLAPVFSLFDFLEIGDAVYSDIVTKFANGVVS